MDNHSFDTLFRDIESAWDGPPLTQSRVQQAEERLGVKLPASYIEVLRFRNGGLLKRHRFPLYVPLLRGYLSMPVLMGIGGEESIDSLRNGESLSSYLIRQWGYPAGIVICHFGHAGVLLDYSKCGVDGEPSIVFAYSERYPDVMVIPVNLHFASFIRKLSEPAPG